MAEPMISEVVDVRSGYTEYVDLRTELFTESKNWARMASYRPITAHRQVFQKVFKSHTLKDKRCYLITSVYGTGKSHLCLTLANYLQTPADEPLMRTFLEQYAAVDPEGAEKLRAARPEGRYLIALCDWGYKGEFDEIVLRAVNTALKRDGFTDDLQTPYLQALKKLQEWQQLAESGDARGNFWQAFEQRLMEHSPERTLASFTKELLSFERAALETFKRIHQEITTAPFAYDKADLIDVLTATLASPAFKERFLGMLVLFDEFGDTMAQGEMSPKAFQQFAQLCADPPRDCAKLMFVGTSHKDLKHYAKSYNATEFRLASDRIEAISLERTGVEDIITAIITPKKTEGLWQEKVAPHAETWDFLLDECQRLKVFSELPVVKIRETIIEDFYPMHPMATSVLLSLVGDVASNNRSVFTFFSEEVSPEAALGSYGHYVATSPIGTSKKLNLYTADHLFDYFAANLKADNHELRPTIRTYLKDYENALRELRLLPEPEYQDDPLVSRILRLMVLYQIVGFPCTLDTLQFGLYVSTSAERSALDNRLRGLTSKRIVYLVKDTGAYEFKQSSSADLERRIDDYMRDPMNPPINSALELTQLLPLEKKKDLYLEANEYNAPYGEDKRLERRFVRAIDLGEEELTPYGPRSYFEKLDEEIEQEITKKGEFEGIALHVVCETTEELQHARDLCTHNHSDRIVVALPKQPMNFRDLLLEIQAIQSVKDSKEAETFSLQDRAALEERLHGDGKRQGVLGLLRIRRNKLLVGKEIAWYGRYGQALSLHENTTSDPADWVMERLYAGGHNAFQHEDINKVHGKGDRGRNSALKEAIEKLLDPFTPLTIDRGFQVGRGEIRYLDRCFLQQNALVHVKTEGTKLCCELEADPSKYASKLPALAAMVSDIRALPADEPFRLTDWFNKYRKPPYGQGTVALNLLLAYLCRLFGESIYVKQDDAAIGDLPIRSLEAITGLVDGHAPQAVLGYRRLRREEREWFSQVAMIFGSPDSAARHGYTAMEAHTLLKDWWNALPSVASIPTLYPREHYPLTASFIEIMQKSGARDAHSFLLTELPPALGATEKITLSSLDRLAAQLAQEKQTLGSAMAIMEGAITDALSPCFDLPPRSTSSELIAAATAWYKHLEPDQQDAHAIWPRDAKSLLLALRSIDTFQETFLIRLPMDYGLKAVDQWRADRTLEYTERIKQAKMHIDAQRVRIEMADVHYDGQHDQEHDGLVYFPETLRLTFSHPNPQASIWVAEDAADPREFTAIRTQVDGTSPLEIQSTKILQVAVQDPEENWSKVKTIRLIKQQAVAPPQRGTLLETVQLVPTDEVVVRSDPAEHEESFALRLRSLIRSGLAQHRITVEEVVALAQQLLDEFTGEGNGAYHTTD
jgi:hypothetical protein